MEEVSLNGIGLLPKISSLFNNSNLSDVAIIFVCSTGQNERVYGHKLILALRSKVFASMFYGKKEKLSELKLPLSKKSSFSSLLRFLYTDDVQLHSFEEAQELSELADEYGVGELVEKCSDYLLHESLTIENVFPNYEYALKKIVLEILTRCHDFVCANAQLVLESTHFTNASVKVVEDIVKQDNLSVLSELEVICAVLKWGSEELKRKEITQDENCLRECIYPFMKHMRFLTLSPEEFTNFVKDFNIFTGYESSLLTRKIYQPELILDFPESLCSISVERGRRNESKVKSFASIIKNTLLDSFSKSTVPTSSSTRALPDSFLSNGSISPSKKSVFISSTCKSTADISDSKTRVSNDPVFPTTHINKISYRIKKKSLFDVTNVSESQVKLLQDTLKEQSQSKQTFSSPSVVDMTHLLANITHKDRLLDFEFPLLEREPCLETSFSKDVKSTIIFIMKFGSIRLHGFELKVRKENNRSIEDFNIAVNLSGFSEQAFNDVFKRELKNGGLAITFHEKMILQEGCKGILEVSIENLILNRCGTCINDKGYELNGLNFACDISLKSTQKADNGFHFLISKLIYDSC